jgi:hypothetical protein
MCIGYGWEAAARVRLVLLTHHGVAYHLLLLLRQATEDFMVHLFEDCNLCAIHAKRVTISECTTVQNTVDTR